MAGPINSLVDPIGILAPPIKKARMIRGSFMKNSEFNANEIIPAFDEFLSKEGLRFEAIAIGGSALNILGVVTRTTQDLDLLSSPIPPVIATAAKAFAISQGIQSDWLNTGPIDLIQHFPNNWMNDLVPLYTGQSLKLKTLARQLFINVKFWAICDRARDIDDLIAMAPTSNELRAAVEWTTPLDGNQHWPQFVQTNAKRLATILGH